MPSRMYNIMSAGKPILAVAEEGSEIARVLLEENIGWVVAPGSPELIAKTILEANANRPWLQEMSVQACRVATEKYAKPIIMRKHRDLMDTYHV